MHHSKYPGLGILDTLHELLYGFSGDYSKWGLYESLPTKSLTRQDFSKRLYSLANNGYVTYVNNKVSFTSKGKEKAIVRKLSSIQLQKRRDGHSRIIAFDIPEKMRRARDIIRGKLKEFECVKIQKSLYQTPYVCEREIREVSSILKIEQYVYVLKLAK